MQRHLDFEEAVSGESERGITKIRSAGISSGKRNSFVSVKKASIRIKGRYRGIISDLAKVIIAVAALFAFVVALGPVYLVAYIESTVVFLTFLPRTYVKIVDGDNIFSFRERDRNMKLRYRLLEEIEYLMKKQI